MATGGVLKSIVLTTAPVFLRLSSDGTKLFVVGLNTCEEEGPFTVQLVSVATGAVIASSLEYPGGEVPSTCLVLALPVGEVSIYLSFRMPRSRAVGAKATGLEVRPGSKPELLSETEYTKYLD
jgi:hypothetical protein